MTRSNEVNIYTAELTCIQSTFSDDGILRNTDIQNISRRIRNCSGNKVCRQSDMTVIIVIFFGPGF